MELGSYMHENGKITYEVLTDHLQMAQTYILDSEFNTRKYCTSYPYKFARIPQNVLLNFEINREAQSIFSNFEPFLWWWWWVGEGGSHFQLHA